MPKKQEGPESFESVLIVLRQVSQAFVHNYKEGMIGFRVVSIVTGTVSGESKNHCRHYLLVAQLATETFRCN